MWAHLESDDLTLVDVLFKQSRVSWNQLLSLI